MNQANSIESKLHQFGNVVVRIIIVLSVLLSNLAIDVDKVFARASEEVNDQLLINSSESDGIKSPGDSHTEALVENYAYDETPGLTVEYFENMYLIPPAAYVQDEVEINHNWEWSSPFDFTNEQFSTLWYGNLVNNEITEPEVFTFTSTADEGIRLWIDGNLVIDAWVWEGYSEHTGQFTLEPGVMYEFVYEHYEYDGLAYAQLEMESATVARRYMAASDFMKIDLTGYQVDYSYSKSSALADGSDSVTVDVTILDENDLPVSDDVYMRIDGKKDSVNGVEVSKSDWILINESATSGVYEFELSSSEPGEKGIIVKIGNFQLNVIDYFTFELADINSGLQGEYFTNIDLEAPSFAIIDNQVVDFNWQYDAPVDGMSTDHYSVRWTGYVTPDYSELYTFYTYSDDGMRLWIDGVQLVDAWYYQGPTHYSGTYTMTAGEKYSLVLEYFEDTGGSVAGLEWESASQAREIITRDNLSMPVDQNYTVGVDFSKTEVLNDGVDSTMISVTLTDSEGSAVNNEDVYVRISGTENIFNDVAIEESDWSALIPVGDKGQYIGELKSTLAEAKNIEVMISNQILDEIYSVNFTADPGAYPECEIETYTNEDEEESTRILVEESESCRLIPADYSIGYLYVAGTLYLESDNYYDGDAGSYSSDYVHLTVSDVEITTTGHISADGQGYVSGDGPGAPDDGDESTTPGGAGYGGYGGDGDLAGGNAYTGNMIDPGNSELLSGSGGGGPDGGSGGGIVDITVSGSFINNGQISADGENGTNYSTSYTSGGGAGGSIYLYTPNITGSGSISANGGNSADDCSTYNCGGGGSGGRIIVADFGSAYSGTIEAFGGMGLSTQYAGAGTIFKKFSTDAYANRLFVDNNGHNGKETVVKPDIVKVNYLMETYINGSGNLLVESTNESGVEEACEFIGPWTVLGDGTGTLVTLCDIETPSYEFMEVDGYDLVILGDTSGMNDLTITDGDVVLFTSAESIVQTLRDVTIASGSSLALVPNSSEGIISLNANSINVADGASIWSDGGNRAIEIEVATEFGIDGSVFSNGSSGDDGGNITIITETLSGEGIIQANGSDGEYFGNGGDIDLHYDTSSFTGSVQSYGGQYSEYAGNPGIIVYNVYDKLIVDNQGNAGTVTIPEGTYSYDRIELGNAIELIFAGDNTELEIVDGVYSFNGEVYAITPILTIEGTFLYSSEFVVDNVILNWTGDGGYDYIVDISDTSVDANGYDTSVITLNLTDSEGSPLSREDVYIRVSGEGNAINGSSISADEWINIEESGTAGEYFVELSSTIVGIKEIEFKVGYSIISNGDSVAFIQASDGIGFYAEYYETSAFEGTPCAIIHGEVINLDINGTWPAEVAQNCSDIGSVRWRGSISADFTGTYRFDVPIRAMNVWIDGSTKGSLFTYMTKSMVAGEEVPIVVEIDNPTWYGDYVATLEWETDGLEREIVPAENVTFLNIGLTEISVTKDTIIADGVDSTDITVHALRDEGTPLVGYPVYFWVNGSGNYFDGTEIAVIEWVEIGITDETGTMTTTMTTTSGMGSKRVIVKLDQMYLEELAIIGQYPDVYYFETLFEGETYDLEIGPTGDIEPIYTGDPTLVTFWLFSSNNGFMDTVNGTATLSVEDEDAQYETTVEIVDGIGQAYITWSQTGDQLLSIVGDGELNEAIGNRTAPVTDSLIVTDGETYYFDEVRSYLTSDVSSGENTITVADSTGFYPGHRVLLIKMTGDDAGENELVEIANVSGNQLELTTNLNIDYLTANGITQVLVIPRIDYITVQENGILTTNYWSGYHGGVLYLDAISLSVESGGVVQANAKGFYPQTGTGAGTRGIGGGYGGEGAASSYPSTKGRPYGMPFTPMLLGSGGGNYDYAGGGRGAGILTINAAQIINEGTISATGGTGGDYYANEGGGGSGGSIYVTTDSLSGTGVIQANGGRGGQWMGYVGYGGGGGRIALDVVTNQYTGTVQAFGGYGKIYGGAGSIYWTNSDTLIIDNNNYNSGNFASELLSDTYDFAAIQLTNKGSLNIAGTDSVIDISGSTVTGDGTATLTSEGQVLVNGPLTASDFSLDVQGELVGATSVVVGADQVVDMYSTTSLYDGAFTFDSVEVQSDGTLYLHTVDDGDADYANDDPFELISDNVSVAADGLISLDGTGYMITTDTGNGPGGGWGSSTSGSYGVGGSHGGLAGESPAGTASEDVYGDMQSPVTMGSAGGRGGTSVGGNGGGALHLSVSNLLELYGSITANGNTAVTNGGAGAGGSLWIEAAQIDGDGSLIADGGNSPSSSGGGGGRISINAPVVSPDIVINVEGGTGANESVHGSIYTGEIDATASSVVADPMEVAFGGGSVSDVLVTVISVSGHAIPYKTIDITLIDGDTVLLNDDSLLINQTVSLSETDLNGEMHFDVSATTLGARDLLITVNGVELEDHAVIDFTVGDFDPNVSTIEREPQDVPADGVSTAAITATAKNIDSEPIINVDINFSADGNAVVTQPTELTDANGQAVGYVSNSVAENVTVTADAWGVPFQSSTIVNFYGTNFVSILNVPTRVLPSQAVQLNVVVRNLEAYDVDDVTVVLTLPELITYSSDSSGVTPDVVDQVYTWIIPEMAAGENINFNVNGVISDTVVDGDTMSITLNASSAVAELDATNNTTQADLTIVQGYSFDASISPTDTSLYIGGEATYTINVQNVDILPDVYTISVDGLDALDVTLSTTELAVNAGGSKNATLTIGTANCISDPLMNFNVTVTSSQSGIEQVIPATVTFDSSPQIKLQAPANNVTSGSQSVLFRWITDPETTGTLSIYPTDDPSAVQTYTTASGLNHSVQVENLTRNTNYTWHVDVVSACGSNSSIERVLDIGNGIVFSNHNQNIAVNRDYDQRIDVAVSNTDSIAHTLTSSVINPYEDLIVNFVDSGSVDQTITLEPGETANLTLAVHAQDAELHDYVLTANLIADEDTVPIIDNAVLNVEVLFEGDYSIVEDVDAYDPVTLAHTYVITNHGQTITDLSLEAIDPSTGLPASVYITPNLDHAMIETGESIRVVAYPLFSEEDAANHIAYASTLHMAKRALESQTDIPFVLNFKGAGISKAISGIATCGDGREIYTVTVTECELSFITKAWYCTNRPTITTSFQVPAFLDQASISGVSVDMTFSPASDAKYHNGELYFNGTEIIRFENSYPQGTYNFGVPVETWHDAIAGLATQTLKLVSYHPNSGHYIVSTGYRLNVNVDNAKTFACAATEAEAIQSVTSMYPCNATASFNPETDVYEKSIWALGEIKAQIKAIAAAQGYDINVSICTQGTCADPIDSRTGVFSFATPDISFPTSAGTLAFQRAYSTGAVEEYTTVGYGWTHNHEERLIFPDSTYGMEDYMIFRDHLGNQHLFKIEDDGTYTPGPGVLAELEAVTDGYQVTTADNHVFAFNDIGMILSISDAQGNAFTYTYDGEGLLQRVSADDNTRYLDFTYNDDYRIEAVTDYTGRAVTFVYDENEDLVESTDLLNQVWSYEYDANHRMTGVNDPTGLETITNEYDMLGRAYKQFDGEGNLLTRIVYHDDGSVTVYDEDGHHETHSYDSRGIMIDETDQVNRGTDTNYDANFRPTSITNEIGSELTMEWSEDGKQLLAEVDPAGNRTEYAYDENGNLISTTDPSGNTKSYTYDGDLLTSSTDIEGKTTTYTYTAEGWLETQTDAYGRTTTYTYDEHGQRLNTTDWLGVTIGNTYDELGRQIESVDEQGRVNRNEYNAAGQLVRSIRNYDAARPQNDGNVYNLITEYSYDVYGNQKTVTDTLGHTTTYFYNSAGRLTSTVDAMGHETTNTYDANGQLVKSTDALGRETTYVYDAAGRRLSTINALGISSGTTTFDLANNASTASDSEGNAATYYYNALNQVVRIVDPMGHETSTTYNENGNVETRTDELGRVTTYEYDALNRLVKTTDASGAITETVYDENGYRTATIDALGNETTYTYDEMGRVVSTTDALGHTTSSDYDDEGKLVSTTDAMGRVTSYTYDEWGRKESMTDGAGRTTTYTYDELDRVISTSGPTGTTSTVYDALGRVVSRTDVRGHTTTTTYDDLGRVKTTTDYLGNVTENFYDIVGNLVASRLNEDDATGYEYDALNRQVAVTDPLGNRSETVYDNLGNVSDTINAKGVVTHYIYDSLQRNTAIIQNYKPGEEANADTNVRVDYTYNAVGNRTYVNDANGHVTEFQYDAANRVTRKIDPIGNTWDYVYDDAGNLTSRTDGNGVTTYFVYDDGGNLLTIDYPDGETDVSFTYNNAGQRVTMTDGIGTTTWNYDDLSRVESVNDAYGNEIVYTYDVYGNRTGLQYADGKQVAYDFDTNNRLIEVASWDSLETEYDYDALGQLTNILRPNGVESTYEYDVLGRLTALDHSNDVTSLANYTYTYDELGNIIHAEENVMGGGSYGPTILVTVVDSTGEALEGNTVYAYSGDEYSNYSKVTDEKGQVSITLPDGTYRFRVDVDGTEFWSGESDHCEIGACGQVTMTIPEAVLVTVIDSNNNYLAEQTVYAFEGETYSNHSGQTDENGQVSLRLPEGDYRFRATLNGTQFWSATLEDEQCTVPGCTVDEILVTVPLVVTVQNDLGDPMPELTVYAYDGEIYSNVSGQTNEEGQVELTLPEGEYHFRANYNGTEFWSAEANHCAIPGCSEAAITVSLPVTVTISDTAGALISGINVYAFDETTYQNFSKQTDENGEAIFTLPGGNYRFRADYNGTQFWSGSENTCEIPGCTADAVTVTQPITVTVLDSNGAPQDGLNVYAYDGTSYANYSKQTDENGEAVFTLPLGDYRFRVDLNGTQFWSGTENTCSLPDCGSDQVNVTIPVEVMVLNGADGAASVNVYAFNETVYTGYSKTTDSEGVAIFTLPEGEYRFRADYAGEQIFSGENNHCAIPGCELVSIQVGTEPTETPTVMSTEAFTETPTPELTETITPVQTTVPAFTNTPVTENTNTPLPVETDTPEPVNTDTPEPVNSNTPSPMYSSTPTQTIGMISRGRGLAKLRLAPLADDTGVSVTVLDSDGTPQSGLNVYVFDGSTYSGTSAVTNESGIASFTLAEGSYRFRADLNGTRFWSGEDNTCTTPSCVSDSVTVTKPLTITVVDSDGTAQSGLNVYAFNGTTYAGYSKVTNESGEAIFTLPEGDYHFRADLNGTRFWSGTENHCTLPGCESASVTVTKPVIVTVSNSNGTLQSGLNVYAFNGTTYSGYSKVTDENGAAVFTLPEGDYRFRADLNGTRFWSADENHCTLPGCESVDVSVSVPLTVSVVDTDGTPQSGIAVYAFNGTTYMNYSKTTDEYGQAVFTLPDGDYRFRADASGTQYWSSEENDCTLPGCTATTVTTSKPVTVSVVDSFGAAMSGLNVYAFDGTTYSGYSKVSDEYGNAVFYLPAGDYRFRADREGTQFWSSEENACTIPGCENVIISVTLSVTVNVVDTDGTPQEGLNVYAFDGETYSNYSEVTDEYGQAVFSLPEGDYHFRADVPPISGAGGSTQFWSADENTCTLPGCISDSVTVTKPVTVTVAGEEGNPYNEVTVYAFDGETYSGYSAVTDGGGHVTFTLPQGSYHFRADFDGVQFWSNNENSCTIPGCEEDSVILPGGTGEQEVSIDYTYDALNRLINAEYSNGTAFGYTYDAAGNVLTYAETHYGQTTVTTYTYDAANQLLTAVEDETVWQYSYDGNGSLIQTNPGAEVANGSTRYTYNTAGYLTKVENYTTEWQTQSDMTYDGLGNRLEATTYTDGEGNTTRYVLEGGTDLTAIGAENTTYYLYGLGAIGTLGESWSYMLQDGAGSTRQLADEEGAVNLSVSYTPWGDTMEIYGSGMLNLGYLGGVYDAGTGLIYMGNGQYYDPGIGRFLTRGMSDTSTNPYSPSDSDQSGMLIAPLVLLTLVFGRKKKRTKFDQFFILFVIVLSVGLSVSAFTSYQPDTIGSSVYTSFLSDVSPNKDISLPLLQTNEYNAATVNNNSTSAGLYLKPINTTTSSKELDCIDADKPDETGEEYYWDILWHYISFENFPPEKPKYEGYVKQGIKDTARAFARVTGRDPIESFVYVYDLSIERKFRMVIGSCNECYGVGGYTYSSRWIEFDNENPFWTGYCSEGDKNRTYLEADYLSLHEVVHELGHAFAIGFGFRPIASENGPTGPWTYPADSPYGEGIESLPALGLDVVPYQLDFFYTSDKGFKMAPTMPIHLDSLWRQHRYHAEESVGTSKHESFADMFLSWVYGGAGFSADSYGAARYYYMDRNMPRWVNRQFGKTELKYLLLRD